MHDSKPCHKIKVPIKKGEEKLKLRQWRMFSRFKKSFCLSRHKHADPCKDSKEKGASTRINKDLLVNNKSLMKHSHTHKGMDIDS